MNDITEREIRIVRNESSQILELCFDWEMCEQEIKSRNEATHHGKFLRIENGKTYFELY